MVVKSQRKSLRPTTFYVQTFQPRSNSRVYACRDFTKTYGVIPEDFDRFFNEYLADMLRQEAAKASRETLARLMKMRQWVSGMWTSEPKQNVLSWLDRQAEAHKQLLSLSEKAFTVFIWKLARSLCGLRANRRRSRLENVSSKRVAWYDLAWLVGWFNKKQWSSKPPAGFWPKGWDSPNALKQRCKSLSGKKNTQDIDSFITKHSPLVVTLKGTKRARKK